MEAGDGDGDTDTRLTVSLKESLSHAAPAPLASFTLCMWYYATAFLDASTLLSYATSNQMDDVIRLRPNPDEFTVTYMQDIHRLPDFPSLVVPERWQSICFLGDPEGWTLWLEENVTRYEVAISPLAVDGVVVLGQEQDILDGGYTKDQSFQGKLTGLTLWPLALSTAQLLNWLSCIMPDTVPLLVWDDITWTAHNKTGDITVHEEGPCDEGGAAARKFLLFTSKMAALEAKQFLNIIGFDIVVPRDDKEIETISELVGENQHHCPLKVKDGFGAWMGLLYNSQSDEGSNLAGERVDWLNFKKRVRNISPNRNVVQSSGDDWFLLKGGLQMCFVGTPRGRRVFRLRGLPPKLTEDVSPLAFSFVLARHPGQGVYFHGFRKLHIKKVANTSRWCLSGNELHHTLCVDLQKLPVGRHKWMAEQQEQEQQQQQQHTGVMKLSLSTCADHQYTCSDATCVQLSKVCDFEFDCSDQSDEVGCTTALLPQGYLHSYPPSVPLPVLAAVTVKRIVNFDLLSMTFQVNLDLKLYWMDSWITFSNLGEDYKKVTTDDDKQVWRPEVIVQNSPTPPYTVSELSVKRQGRGRPTERGYTFPGAENQLVETKTIKAIVNCDFRLRWYPWDDQLCFLTLVVTNVRESGLLLNQSSGVLSCPTLLEEYKVASCALGKEEGPTNTITVYLKLSRRYEYHLFTTFLPTSLLLILGYGTLLLPVESFNERGIMSLTLLLVFISLYTETSNSLPSTAYLKHIDVWFVFNLTYLSVIISVHLAAFHTPTSATPLMHVKPWKPGSNTWTSEMTKKDERKPISSDKILRVSRKVLAFVFVVFTLVYSVLLVV
ncbi:uncharacterized protein LOC123508321 isoform X2 [Portunus trituberculatus]|nr:uncharacterized protein LOC123508321 isoform X2 [Portunus trituberculatus]